MGTQSTLAVPQIGPLLRSWKQERGKSQLDLSMDTGISQRHLSFVESGRSAPSRDFLSIVSDALNIPLRERNVLLLASVRGFANSSSVPPLPSFSGRDPVVIYASPSEDAWALTTTVCRLHLPVSSPATLAFPRKGSGSAYREHPLKRLLSGANFRGCSHFIMFRPLRLLATLVALHLHCFQQGSL